MTHNRAVTFLKIACGVTMAMGIGTVFALATQTFGLLSWFMDLLHLPLDGQQSFGADSERVLGAIGGGLMFGLGLMVWQIVDLIYVEDPVKGAKIILWGLWGWYIADSLGSVLAGAWFNAILNASFLALFLLPILLAKPRQPVTA
ncbi:MULTISPECIES: excinuclease ABC subunit A [unclassified Shimia]|uniref:excinuclease ABC subunit A n=1 Tax=unclassified Shimia TaxID=2630038 RepID=UPI003101D078